MIWEGQFLNAHGNGRRNTAAGLPDSSASWVPPATGRERSPWMRAVQGGCWKCSKMHEKGWIYKEAEL